jgi:DNA-binding NtrC family response regulator
VELDYRAFPILVVDDEPDILRAFELSYGDDFTILTAGAGARALEILGAEDVSVIVSDQRMPGMDGSEFLERSMDVRPYAVRIVLTGYTDIDAWCAP